MNFTKFNDSFQSLLTGLGVWGRDRTLSMRPRLNDWEQLTWDKDGLDALYRGNWLSRKIVDIPAFDATRAWRTWNGTQEQIEALETTERQFGIQRKMLSALTKARLYGGSAIIMGIKGDDFQTELNLDKIKAGDLAFVHVVEKWMIAAGPRVRDITSPWFGEPNYYMRSNIPIIEAPGGVQQLPGSGIVGAPELYIHPSRVVRLVGLDYPDIEMAPDAWGDSVLQPVYSSLREAGLVSGSLANLISDCKVDIYRIPGLTNTLSTSSGTQQIMNYLSNANAAKSVLNALLMDKEFEHDRVETHFEGVPKVLEMFLLIAAAAADIPSTRLLSREPSGQNSTGDSDIRNYYDRLHADQKVRLTPVINRLDEVLIRTTFGKRDPALDYDWNSLWQMSDTEKADIALKKAQAFQIDNAAGLIPPAALATARENQLIQDDFYPGLETALDEWQEEQFLSELDNPDNSEPQKQLPPPASGKGDNPDDEDDDLDKPSVSQQKTTDEDQGHPFRGNQYQTGEAGGGQQHPQVKKLKGQVKRLMIERTRHSKTEIYARGARLLAKARDERARQERNKLIEEAYHRDGAKALRFANEPLSYRILDSVADKFSKDNFALVKQFTASHIATFGAEHVVGVAHQVAFRHILMPALEGALIAGLAEFGVPEAAAGTAIAIEIVHYAAHHIVEHSSLSQEHAVDLLQHAVHALSDGWRAVIHHGTPHDGLTDADDYGSILVNLSRFERAIDKYGPMIARGTQPESSELAS